MAKLLQPNNSGAAPRRVTLKTSGPAPKTTLKLKGADGKAITPRKAPEPTPAPEAEEPAVDEAALKAAEEADRLAQEEYERQMAEYEKQMEEYNRQMAEYQAAEEARLAAEAEEARKAEEARLAAEAAAAEEARKAEEAAAAAAAAAAPKPATTTLKPAAAKPRLSVARPAGLKPSGIALKPAVAKPAAKPAAAAPAEPAPEPAPAAAEAPAPQPAAKAAAPRVALPKAGAVPAPGKPKAKKKAAPKPAAPAPEDAEAALAAMADVPEEELSEEELAMRDAYLEQLQKQAAAPKIWQLPIFKYACMGLGGTLAVLAVIAFFSGQNRKAIEEHSKYINQYLLIAQDLNKQQIETLADVKEKNVKFTCPPEAAQDLLGLVVNPFVKRADGKNKYGGDPKGVALNACLVLGIAAEQNPEIDKMIFATLGEQCTQMEPDIFSWLIQRMSVSNNKGIKGKLKKLAKTVAAKPKWKHKAKMLSAVWNCIGLRVSAKDLDEITALLGDESIDSQLAKSLSICVCNLLELTEGEEARQQIGDEVFDKLPAKYREYVIDALAKSSSPKALAFYKAEMEDPATWENDGQVRFGVATRFFQFYGSDDVIDYLLELKEKAKDNAGHLRAIEGALQGVFVQNRERTEEQTQRLLGLIFDKINEDTSKYQEINIMLDPDSPDSIIYGKEKSEYENDPKYQELAEKRKALDDCRKQKNQLINALSGLRDYKWVMSLLAKYAEDADSDIAYKASKAIDKVKKNTATHIETQSRYKARGKE